MRKTFPLLLKSGFLVLSLCIGNWSNLYAQNGETSTNPLHNTWYEWPHESANGQTVYKSTKYLPVPGIDKQDELFKMITIGADGSFITSQYCGYCPNVTITEQKSNYKASTLGKTTELKIYSDKSKQTSVNVVSVDKEKLVLSATK